MIKHHSDKQMKKATQARYTGAHSKCIMRLNSNLKIERTAHIYAYTVARCEPSA